MLLPLVSIVIPCYNHEEFVQDSIQSVINQTYENIELIIIDDGSKDSSVEKIQKMISTCTKRFTRFEFRSRPNKGLSATLNEALEWCEGTYYSALASDDIFLKNKIQSQIDCFLKLNNEKIVGIFGGYNLIDINNKVIKTILSKNKIYNFNDIFLHNFNLPAPTALLKLENVKKVGGYDEKLKIEDWFMWLKLTEDGNKLMSFEQILVNYRSHESNTSKNLEFMNIERKKVIDCFNDNENYSSAKIKLEWLNTTDSLYINKKNSFLKLKKLLRNKPLKLFSIDMIRFIFHYFKSIFIK